MRARRIASPHFLASCLVLLAARQVKAEPSAMPAVAENWSIALVKQAPEIVFPTAIVTAPDGTIYLGQDPMDMPGPPTVPADSVVAIKDGKVRVFADKLWAVMGLEWADDTLFVVHAPFLSAFQDADGDGKADRRVDLMTGLGPKLPGFSGINDHVASGVRLGMDGYLYISVGDKGIPRGVGKDGTAIQLFGGGVIRIRPDGTGLEVVSTGERNPLSVALSRVDDIFTYGNDDDAKKWPNSLTHHVVGGHYGYPYEFLSHPSRALPIMQGQLGGSGTQGICYDEDGLPDSYRGNLFFCDWGLQTVFRYAIEKDGATFRVKSRTPLVTKGSVDDFRPFSLCVSNDPASLYLVDWAYNGWLDDGPKTGRLYRMTYVGKDRPTPAPRPIAMARVENLDHPALSVRLASQRRLTKEAVVAAGPLERKLKEAGSVTGRIHALWALDRIGTASAANSIRGRLTDVAPAIRLQAARSCGVRRDQGAVNLLIALLRDGDPAARREAAIALGRIKSPSSMPALMAALGDADIFVAWSIRHAIRACISWDQKALTEALLDPKRREDALKLCDEAWSPAVVEAIGKALGQTTEPDARARLVATLAGLYFRYPAWSGAWFGTNPLAGQLPKKTEPWDKAAMGRIQETLAATLKDPSPSVRLQAVAGLFPIGQPAVEFLRAALDVETDPRNQATIAEALGVLGDHLAAPKLGTIVLDASRAESVRIAALDALGSLRGPEALRARISLVYDPKAPPSLIARALGPLGREGIIPPNDLAGFLDHADPGVRAACLRAFIAPRRKPASGEIRENVLARLNDKDAEVRRAAMNAIAALGVREAVPRLVSMALDESLRSDAILALAAMPDAQAWPAYLSALGDRNPEVRRAGEQALLAIRDRVGRDLEAAAKSGKLDGPAALALERILTRFTPIVDWKVIGPFARTTAQVFIGEPSIDFHRAHSGAGGPSIRWAGRRGEADTGRVVLDDFKNGAGDRGGFGYDSNGSPDLAAFAFAEVDSPTDREALFLVGSSGSLIITLNEQPILNYGNFAGRPYRPDSDLVPVSLKKGKNRLLLRTRQGIGSWSFSVQASDPNRVIVVSRTPRAVGPEVLRSYALSRDGDPKNGEAIFFDAKGIGCVKCHAVNGRGQANFGPDLAGLALKYDKEEIIRSVLDPSDRIATGYQPTLVATKDGKVVNGLIRAENDSFLELVDGETKLVRVPKSEIEERKIGDVSVMPSGVVDSLSRVEFADLVSYLSSLKSSTAEVKH